jgi:hypothetical protein
MIDSTIDQRSRLRVLRAAGVISAEETISMFSDLVNVPPDGPVDAIVDLRHVERLEAHDDEFQQVAEVLQRKDASGLERWTAIIAPADHVYSMARMYATVRGPSPERVCVFRTTEDALLWLAMRELAANRVEPN